MPSTFHGTNVDLRCRCDGPTIHLDVAPVGYPLARMAGLALDYGSNADLVVLQRACDAFNAEIATGLRRAIVFPRQEQDWAALKSAEAALAGAGFSIGPSCVFSPRGILFGAVAVAKWRNLTDAHRATLHGIMEGDNRSGPLTVTLRDTAPEAARRAFQRMSEMARAA